VFLTSVLLTISQNHHAHSLILATIDCIASIDSVPTPPATVQEAATARAAVLMNFTRPFIITDACEGIRRLHLPYVVQVHPKFYGSCTAHSIIEQIVNDL